MYTARSNRVTHSTFIIPERRLIQANQAAISGREHGCASKFKSSFVRFVSRVARRVVGKPACSSLRPRRELECLCIRLHKKRNTRKCVYTRMANARQLPLSSPSSGPHSRCLSPEPVFITFYILQPALYFCRYLPWRRVLLFFLFFSVSFFFSFLSSRRSCVQIVLFLRSFVIIASRVFCILRLVHFAFRSLRRFSFQLRTLNRPLSLLPRG